jgi:hypothetical protein
LIHRLEGKFHNQYAEMVNAKQVKMELRVLRIASLRAVWAKENHLMQQGKNQKSSKNAVRDL